jgi:hypothetical protein
LTSAEKDIIEVTVVVSDIGEKRTVIEMRKLMVLGAAFFLVSSLMAFAGYGTGTKRASEKGADPAQVMKLKGVIIDNNCAAANEKDLGTFIKTHPKTCTLKPACAASGYALYANGKLYRFDKASSDKVHEFLEKPSSKLKVVVKAEKAGDELILLSIKNQGY